jgi:hypothetical protein
VTHEEVCELKYHRVAQKLPAVLSNAGEVLRSHPNRQRRTEMLDVLQDARTEIDRLVETPNILCRISLGRTPPPGY